MARLQGWRKFMKFRHWAVVWLLCGAGVVLILVLILLFPGVFMGQWDGI